MYVSVLPTQSLFVVGVSVTYPIGSYLESNIRLYASGVLQVCFGTMRKQMSNK